MTGNYREGWGLGAWGQFPWPSSEAAAYFLPPTEKAYAPGWYRYPIAVRPSGGSYRRLDWHRRGVDSDGTGGITVAGKHYGGGRWNGPLTQAQVNALISAGYGARIYYSAPDGTGLPAAID